MPSKSPAQHRLMEMVAHDPAMAQKTGVPVSVAQEFVAADKGKHFAGKKRRTARQALEHASQMVRGHG